jgi:hypothetical protein
VFVTNTVSSLPLGASNSSSALEHFELLSADMTLLRDMTYYPSCEGTACTLVEQLDLEKEEVEEEEEGGGGHTPRDGSGTAVRSCTLTITTITITAFQAILITQIILLLTVRIVVLMTAVVAVTDTLSRPRTLRGE